MTHQGVHVGFGTLYTLLEQFLETEMIRETKVEGRRRSYILTDKGRKIKGRERMCQTDSSWLIII